MHGPRVCCAILICLGKVVGGGGTAMSIYSVDRSRLAKFYVWDSALATA